MATIPTCRAASRWCFDRLAAETQETAQFCLLDGNKYTVAMMREGSRPFRISSSVGERTPPFLGPPPAAFCSATSAKTKFAPWCLPKISNCPPASGFYPKSSQGRPGRPSRMAFHLRLHRGQLHALLRGADHPTRRHGGGHALSRRAQADALRNHADYLAKLALAAAALEPSFA